jgi:hypothetical protein
MYSRLANSTTGGVKTLIWRLGDLKIIRLFAATLVRHGAHVCRRPSFVDKSNDNRVVPLPVAKEKSALWPSPRVAG